MDRQTDTESEREREMQSYILKRAFIVLVFVIGCIRTLSISRSGSFCEGK